jgi:hypothetical protein
MLFGFFIPFLFGYNISIEVFFNLHCYYLTKEGRDFAHLALWENAPNMLMRRLLLRTMHFSYKLGPKKL